MPAQEREGAQILICESAQATLEVLRGHLLGAGYRVLVARNPEELIEVLAMHNPDLIMCNTDLSGADGVALMHQLRHGQPAFDEVPILMLSAYTDPSDVAAGKMAVADDYITLPVERDTLLATVLTQMRQVARVRRACKASAMPPAATTGFNFIEAYEALANHFSFGIVMMNTAGHAVHMNASARSMTGRDLRTIRDWLLRRAGLSDNGASVGANRPGHRGAHRAALLGTDEAEELAGPLLITTRPLASDRVADIGTVVLLYAPYSPEDHGVQLVADAVGLTPSETSVAQLLSHGKRIDDIREALSISRPTVNFHLHNIFRKTATVRQADLVALLQCVQLQE